MFHVELNNILVNTIKLLNIMKYRIVLHTSRDGNFYFYIQYRWLIYFWRYTKSKYNFQTFKEADEAVIRRIGEDYEKYKSKVIRKEIIKVYH